MARRDLLFDLISNYETSGRQGDASDCTCPACWAGWIADYVADMHVDECEKLLHMAHDLDREEEKDMLFFSSTEDDECYDMNIDSEFIKLQLGNLMRRQAEVIYDFGMLFEDLAACYEPESVTDKLRVGRCYTGRKISNSFRELSNDLWRQLHCPVCDLKQWTNEGICEVCGHKKGQEVD